MSRINCTAFNRLNEDKLKTFTDKVFAAMHNVAAYDFCQPIVNDMNSIAGAFQAALIKADSRATKDIEEKNHLKAATFFQLTRLARALDAEWSNDDHDDLKVAAHFTLCKPNGHPSKITYVDPPTNFEGFNLRRQTMLFFQWKKAKHAVTTAFEILQEDGTWKNGTYCQKDSMELSFPRGSKITIRAQTIGPEPLKSLHTEPITVYVD